MDDASRRAAAAALADAERSRVAIEPLTVTYDAIDAIDAYAIQLLNISDRLAAGGVVRGHKVGLTSRAMQQMLGVSEPDYGHLLDDMFVFEDAVVPIERYIQPRVEIEVAFVLERPLRGPGVSVADVLRATAFVAPAIEIIDSRVANWKIALADTIADNGSAAGIVLGGRATPVEGLDLRLIGGVLEKNGAVVETGASGAVLGNPATAVAWLANTLAGSGITLEPGHVVMPGSCTRAVDVAKGDSVRAEFAGLGPVAVRFA